MKKHELLSSRDIAKHFGVDGNTVARWVRQNKLKPSFVTPGGHARYTREDVEKLSQQKIEEFMKAPGRTPLTKEERIAARQSLDQDEIQRLRQSSHGWRPARTKSIPSGLRKAGVSYNQLQANEDLKHEPQPLQTEALLDQVVKTLTGLNIEVFSEILKYGTLNELALKLKLSPKALSDLCVRVGLPTPPND